MISPDIFRANDIRGRYPQDFNLSFTQDLAQALYCLSRQKGISPPAFLVGQDARLSSPEISQSLCQRLTKQGASVAFIGLAPSPLCYFLMNHHKLPAVVVVTASHNPPEDNGFKILFHRKYKLFEPIKELKKLVFNPLSSPQRPLKNRQSGVGSKNFSSSLTSSPAGTGTANKNIKHAEDIELAPGSTANKASSVFPTKQLTAEGLHLSVEKEEPYIASLKKEFSLLRPAFSFALDTGNGALGPLAKKAFLALGLRPKILFCQPDGRFPHHHPDPTVENNLTHLKAFMRSKDLELGMGFDGDGDRLVLIGPNGRTIAGDELGVLFLKPLAAAAARKQNKKPLILADVKCSDWFYNMARQEGFEIKMAQSGHGRVRAKMERTGALFALELSGHIFFNDRKNRGFDDALYAGLRVLEILQALSAKKGDISRLLPQAPGCQSPEIRQSLSSKELDQSLCLIRSYLKQKKESFNSTDGIRISRKHSWALIRASQTQSALSMRFGADTQQELDQIKKEFSAVMGQPIP